MLSDQVKSSLYNLLAWQQETGVSETLEARPVNHLSTPETGTRTESGTQVWMPDGTRTGSTPVPRNQRPHATPTFIEPTPRPGGEKATGIAYEHAAAARTIDELKDILESFNGCGLKDTAKNTCFADGDPNAQIMLIGEAPGRDEDIQGRPFVGRAGQLLDKMTAAIGLTRSQLFITNIVFWRPPGNRTPTPAEAAVCRPFTARQIELVKPDILVFLGGSAAKHMLDTTEGIMRLRGKWRRYESENASIPAIATLHPAYLLRQPAQKRLVWHDLLNIRQELDKLTERKQTERKQTGKNEHDS